MVQSISLKQLCKKVRAEVKFGARLDYDKQDDWQRQANGYTVTLHYQRRRLTVDYWMGTAHTNEPTAAEVLECLLSDAAGFDNARSFDDWCSDYGYDTDSRKAERIYKACEKTLADLRRLLGNDFDAFMGADRD